MARIISHQVDVDIYGAGKRTLTIVVAETDKVSAVGVAVLNPEDRFDPEVGKELAKARALGNMARGLEELARQRIDATNRALEAGRACVVNLSKQYKERLQEARAARLIKSHEDRLKRAVEEGRYVQCGACSKWFGLEGNTHPFEKGMHRVCPYCGAVTAAAYIKDAKTGRPSKTMRVVGTTHIIFEKVPEEKLKALCANCGVDECPGAYSDPCDEAKDILASMSPSHKPPTGASGGEPGPSAATAAEGKAVNPQGDDGPRCLVCGKPTTFHYMDGLVELAVRLDHPIEAGRFPFLCEEHYYEAKELAQRRVEAEHVKDVQKAIDSVPPTGGVIVGTTVVEPIEKE